MSLQTKQAEEPQEDWTSWDSVPSEGMKKTATPSEAEQFLDQLWQLAITDMSGVPDVRRSD